MEDVFILIRHGLISNGQYNAFVKIFVLGLMRLLGMVHFKIYKIEQRKVYLLITSWIKE